MGVTGVIGLDIHTEEHGAPAFHLTALSVLVIHNYPPRCWGPLVKR